VTKEIEQINSAFAGVKGVVSLQQIKNIKELYLALRKNERLIFDDQIHKSRQTDKQ